MSEININRLKLSQLRILVAVADSGNFSEAALQMAISQSAVSHAIATLEEELGVVLLYRGRHGAHLTPVGERITAQARQVLQHLDAIAKEAFLEKGLQGGNVRVACFRSVATHILPTAINRFHNYFPNINVSITEYEDYIGVESSLHEGYTDIGFTYLPSNNGLETWEILRDEYILLLPPTAKLKNAQIDWQQLAEYPLIVSAVNSCNVVTQKYLTAAQFPLNIAYQVREDSTIVSMVLQGLGAAIMPRLAAEPIPPKLQVCSLPVPLERIIGVAIVANALHAPAIYAFVDAIRNSGKFATKTAV